MKRFTSAIGGLLVVLLPLLSAGNGHAGPNANANIQLHLLTPTTKNACTELAATPRCANIVTGGDLYPSVYFAYVLVSGGDAEAGIAGVQFGIEYDGPGWNDGVGVDIYSWTLCATLEFITPSSPPWPNSGTGTLITWDPTTRCQRFEPDEGSGVVANAGYFYCAAYTDALFSIVPRPVDGQAKVASCSAAEDTVTTAPRSHLGLAGFGSRYGYSPCGVSDPPPPACSILGPSSVVTGTTGHVYKLNFTPTTPPTWRIDGNGTFMSTSLDSAIVEAGAPGTFLLSAFWSQVEGCSRTVTVEVPVPVLPTTWSGIKSLYREP